MPPGDRAPRLVQNLRRQAGRGLHRHRLIPMVGMGSLQRPKLPLDRRQGKVFRIEILYRLRFAGPRRSRRKSSQGRMAEYLGRAQLPAGAGGQRHDSQPENGVSSLPARKNYPRRPLRERPKALPAPNSSPTRARPRWPEWLSAARRPRALPPVQAMPVGRFSLPEPAAGGPGSQWPSAPGPRAGVR